MNPPADDTPVLEVLIYRLQVMERLLAKAEEERAREREKADAGWRAFSERVDRRFAELSTLMGTLAYVPQAPHVIEHSALEDRLTARASAAAAKADAADRHAWWGIALIVTTVMGIIITATLRTAL